MNRLDCTSHDMLLAVVMSIGVCWMVAEYFWYAHLLHRSESLFSTGAQRTHLLRLMRVFVFCGAIHMANILMLVWTPYFIWAFCYYLNAFVANALNRSFAAAIAKSLSDSEARFRLEEIAKHLDSVEVIDSEEPKTLRQLADELRKIVG